jgi:hypothetical protein
MPRLGAHRKRGDRRVHSRESATSPLPTPPPAAPNANVAVTSVSVSSERAGSSGFVYRAVTRTRRRAVIHSLDPELDAEAMATVAEWRFLSGSLAGLPVDVVVQIVIAFYFR